MAKQKFDGIVDSVRYKSTGEVDWVRAYERRGPTFSDRVLVNRQTLVDRIKSGKKYVTGSRQNLMASTFDVTTTIQLVSSGGKDLLSTSGSPADQDHLEGVPIL